ncbi:hypothetical protein AN641_04335 [Candidatus Epulonipiscioides gigas]|nr:hypothetical protein AN641_04335 [Epulopiscium sp. SCG-C07WGA-EpuloA2]
MNKYIKYHIMSCLRKKLYWLYCFVLYFVLLVIHIKLLSDHNNSIFAFSSFEYTIRMRSQQLYICFGLIFCILMIINEKHLKIYKSHFKIYIENTRTYYISLCLSTVLLNIIPFIIGQTLFFYINKHMTDFYSYELFLTNMTVVITEIITLTLIFIGLFLTVQKTAILVFIYALFVSITPVTNWIYVSIPLIASIYDCTFTPELLISRFILMAIGILIFNVALKKFDLQE